jgi:hypothetical protein
MAITQADAGEILLLVDTMIQRAVEATIAKISHDRNKQKAFNDLLEKLFKLQHPEAFSGEAEQPPAAS